MRIVDIDRNDITEYDLGKGRLIDCQIIKHDATAPDFKTKFAYDDDDYEDAQMFVPRIEVPDDQVTISDITDALADASDAVSSNAEDVATLSDAIAELSEIVAALVPTDTTTETEE